MKRSKKIFALLGVLVIMIVATFIVQALTPDEDTSLTGDDAVVNILSLDTAMIEALSWTYEEQTLSFVFYEDTWSYADDKSFPLNSSYISSMLSSIKNINAEKTIENVQDFSQYGLSEPACTISIGCGTDYTLLIGDETAVDSLRYFSIGDGNVYLVDSSILDAFSYGLYDLVQNESIPDMSDVSSVTIATADNTLVLEYVQTTDADGNSTYSWCYNDNNEQVILDSEYTESFISNITDFTFGECANYNADDETLAAYKLSSPTVTATVVYIENEETKEFTLEFASYMDSIGFVRIADSRMVYSIDTAIIDTLLNTTYDDLQVVEEITEDVTEEITENAAE